LEKKAISLDRVCKTALFEHRNLVNEYSARVWSFGPVFVVFLMGAVFFWREFKKKLHN
jgi:hypothetical protein